MLKAVIIGYSGHSYVVLDSILSANYNVIGYCEQEKKAINPYNLAYFGDERTISVINKLVDSQVFLGVGDNAVRAKIFDHLTKHNISCPSLIDRNANVSKLASIDHGTVVMPGATINALAEIGRAVICNSSCIIEHECLVGDYAHIAPGAVLTGNVTIGERTFIGANTVIRQGITIGKNVIVGAGSVVVKDVQDGEIVYGNPAKKR